MKRHDQLTIRADPDEPMRLVARCDMCGVEHKLRLMPSVLEDGSVALTISVDNPSMQLYSGGF